MQPIQLARLPEGQRVLILAKVSDPVGAEDPKLQFATGRFLDLLLARGLLLDKEEYRIVVPPAIRWAFELTFDGRLGRRFLRGAVRDAAAQAPADAHEVLQEEFSSFLSRVDLDAKEDWYLHAVREVIEAILANPACTGGTSVLTDGYTKVNKIQRSRAKER